VCSYSTIAWVIPATYGHSVPPLTFTPVDYRLPDKSTADLVFGAFNALGSIAFAYAGHNVVLEIQASIPSTLERPSKVPMWRGCVLAYIIVAMCYFPVAFVGYWAYGNQVTDNIITYVAKPKWVVAMANLMVVIHVIGSYQVRKSLLAYKTNDPDTL
jgi:amino acid permease